MISPLWSPCQLISIPCPQIWKFISGLPLPLVVILIIPGDHVLGVGLPMMMHQVLSWKSFTTQLGSSANDYIWAVVAIVHEVNAMCAVCFCVTFQKLDLETA